MQDLKKLNYDNLLLQLHNASNDISVHFFFVKYILLGSFRNVLNFSELPEINKLYFKIFVLIKINQYLFNYLLAKKAIH